MKRFGTLSLVCLVAGCGPAAAPVALRTAAVDITPDNLCPVGVINRKPGTPTMPSPHIVHRYIGNYWRTPSGVSESAAQSARWSRIVSDPAYWAPLAQYGVGQGTWSTPALTNPADASFVAGTILSDDEVGQILYQDVVFEQQQGLPELDPNNTVYVVYFAPGVVPGGILPSLPQSMGGGYDLTSPEHAKANHRDRILPDPYHPGATREYYWATIPYWTAANGQWSGEQLLSQAALEWGQLANRLPWDTIDYNQAHEIDEATSDRDSVWQDANGNEIDDKCESAGAIDGQHTSLSFFDGVNITRVWSNSACSCIDRAAQAPQPAAPASCNIWPSCGGAGNAECDNMGVDHFELRRHSPTDPPWYSIVASTTDTGSPPAVYLSDASISGQSSASYEVCAATVTELYTCTSPISVTIDNTPCPTNGTGGSGGGYNGGPANGPWRGHVAE